MIYFEKNGFSFNNIASLEMSTSWESYFAKEKRPNDETKKEPTTSRKRRLHVMEITGVVLTALFQQVNVMRQAPSA